MKNENVKEIQEAFPTERAAFKPLLISNPNYFGNLPNSPYKEILPMQYNIFYEELGCVGYHPQQQQLEAVVHIKQNNGYGTDVCGAGTTEYVRFYLSYDNGATWHDQGVASFQAYNLQQGNRIEYAVSLKANPPRRFCFTDPLIKVRAILSWNNIPAAGQPYWTPVWGNVKEATIQVEPRRLFFPYELFKEANIKLPLHLQQLLKEDEPIATAVKNLSITELSQQYEQHDVPAHRFAFKEIMQYVSAENTLSAEHLQLLPEKYKLSPDIFELLFPKTDGNTSYEELKCIGLDPNFPNTLVGIIQVKKPNGFSGGPCTGGSSEYVSFWIDTDSNGTFDTFLGTANVTVYDLANIPADGVQYAVRLPIDLNKYRQLCSRGAKTLRIRAILSWNVAVPGTEPNRVPTWGNREEALIHIAPGESISGGKIAILGGIPVSHINAAGLTTPTAKFATNNMAPDVLGRPCPFAGRVTVQGAPVVGHSYAVEVTSEFGEGPVPVVNKLILTRADGTTYEHTANALHRFSYVAFENNINGVLAQWDTAGDARWNVKLSVYNSAGILVGTDTHAIQLDNTGPNADISITVGSGDCGKFTPGTPLSGNFSVSDTYLGSYSIGIEPVIPGNPSTAIPSPNAGFNNTSAAWNLNTTGMLSCGYIIRVVAVDRAIVNSQGVGHYASDSAGFCLL